MEQQVDESDGYGDEEEQLDADINQLDQEIQNMRMNVPQIEAPEGAEDESMMKDGEYYDEEDIDRGE
jgi:hypothetical protein